MVREQKKQEGGIEALKELEQETYSEIEKINGIRKREFESEMDAGYFFSIVFDTKAERDKWLADRGLTLVEGFFIKAQDFKY